ncbi:hypothetical protein [Roseovarius aquimarinus]|uniref:Uncharacterized protein n=1 Tax=Roseovarius aquimarinus TaxID=1229156 RepID=A0ABW7I690_9RHOB
MIILLGVAGWTVTRANFAGALPTWRRGAMWIGAIAFIVAAEAFLPSTRLTGIERPEARSPVMMLSAMAPPDVRTYGDLAEAQPWLWSLGNITHAEAERRIAEDRARLAVLEEEASELSQEGILMRYQFGDLAEGYALLDEVLAGLDLGALYKGGAASIPASALDAKIIAGLVALTTERSDRAGETYMGAQAALDAYLDAKGQTEGDPNDPEYTALRSAMRDASSAFSAQSSQLYRIRGLADLVGGPRAAPAPGRAFPRFSQPITLYSDSETRRLPDEVMTGPRGTGVRMAAHALMDAATGYERAPTRRITRQVCAVIGGGDERAPGTRLCEVAVALPIDYDLTGGDCAPSALPYGANADLGAPGSRMTAIACKEEWIHPHLHVVYGDGAFTVHAPMPEGIAVGDPQGAPLSLWSAMWKGQTQVLEPSATFAWDGKDDVLDGLTLVHGVRPQVREPRIWRDFGRDHPGPALGAITMAGWSFRHGYEPTRLSGFAALKGSEIAPLVLVAGDDDDALRAVADWRRPVLKMAIGQREAMLNHLARFAVPGEALDAIPAGLSGRLQGAGCGYFRPALRPVGNDDLRAELHAEVADVPGGACDAITAQAALFGALERGLAGGSWLWLAAGR